MFEKEYFLRYGDLDKNGKIKISSVLDILQDVSASHSFAVGLSLEKFSQMSLAMVLYGWRVRFLKDIDYTLPVAVRTGVMDADVFSGERGYEIWQCDEPVCIATGKWVAFDTRKMRMIKLPGQIIDAYGGAIPHNGMFFEKLCECENGRVFEKRQVEPRDIDTNNHMNNAKSVEIALDNMPEGFKISELRVVYKRQLCTAEVFEVCGCESDGGFLVELKKDGKVCVAVHAF